MLLQYHGGTNFGRNAAHFVTTRYYDEAPLDEFGEGLENIFLTFLFYLSGLIFNGRFCGNLGVCEKENNNNKLIII